MAKHFKSHWKEMLEEQRKQTEAVERVAQGAVDSTVQDVDDEPDEESGGWRKHWQSTRLKFHQYRYAWLTVSLVVFGVCLLAMHTPDTRPKRVKVSGQVLVNGQPLASGTILFAPYGARPSTGKIDSNGRFSLTCFDGNDGAIVGLQRIAIAPAEAPEEGDPPWPVPLRYADPEASGLTREITGPISDLLVELTTDDAPPRPYAGDMPVTSPPEG